MQRAIFGFAKANDRVKIPDLPNGGTRLDNLEVCKPIGRVVVGHVQWMRRKARPKTACALHFGVINTRPARLAASIIGGCHHD